MKYFDDVVVGDVFVSDPRVVSKQEIIEFASEWDPQPFHVDEAYAAQTGLGLIGSAIHSLALAAKLGNEVAGGPNSTIAGLGWDEVRMRAPLRPGDHVRVRIVVESKRVSQKRPTTGVVVSRVALLNQRDEEIVSHTSTILMGRRPGADVPGATPGEPTE